MNDHKTTVLASRCPSCGAIIAERISRDDLSVNERVIRCRICGEGYLTVSKSAEEKIRLELPCLVCEHSHRFTLNETTFFDKELFLLQCSYSGLDVGFIGEENNVDEALRLSAKTLKEICDENKADEEAQNFMNFEAMQDVMYAVEEMAITNRVRCRCGEPNLAIVIDYDKVHLSCKDCGAKKTIYASDKQDAEKLNEEKSITLDE